jgi:uncharacterized protein (TIGR00299 family) protein
VSAVYFEMIGGASGNMLLGALLDAGADRDALEAALRTIPVDGWTSELQSVNKRGIAATYYDFVVPGEDHHAHDHGAHGHGTARHLSEVLDIVARSGLSASQIARATAIYRRLADAEAKVHGTSADHVHFHEVGATDAILDVAGACIALDLLGIDEIYCSAFPIGRGSIDMEHGRYPNPPPATAELLRGAPTYDAGIAGEMVTTTGAAILSHLVADPGTRPPMTVATIGYGAGRSNFDIPNVLRASIGTVTPFGPGSPGPGGIGGPCRPDFQQNAGPGGIGGPSRPDFQQQVAVIEANIDDMSPQRFELALERTLAAGAFDVWLAPITMKKSRPAVLFGAIAPLEREAAVAHVMLAETTTLGVRVRHERRYTLERTIETATTPYGEIRVKTATFDGQARRSLEYDDLVRIARERQRPLAEIVAAVEAFLSDGR